MKFSIMLLWLVLLACFAYAGGSSYIYQLEEVTVPLIDEQWFPPHCDMVYNQTTLSTKEQCSPLTVVRTYIGWKIINQSTGKIIGVNVNGRVYDGVAHIGKNVSVWAVPIGDRDFNLFPGCRDYEVTKGVCRVVA